MTDERDYLETLEPITEENIDKILGLFKAKYLFITDEADLDNDYTPVDVFVVPLNQDDFRYATQEEYNYWRTDTDEPFNGVPLSKYEYFDFIKGKIHFAEDLYNIEIVE